ncbi:MAG TPA: DNA polymerase/3'-5' exonuclease PolX [Sedimenticola sp.]|nr:DNA polymerase/3'-5' exonuclease PolX [Sedimenticola sp.]
MAVRNEDIAAVFDEMADLLEIEGANPFRVRAYRTAARNLRGLGREVAELVSGGADLSALPGIGKALAAKIREMVQTGNVRALERLHQEVPASLEALLHIPGLGPKRVRALYEQLGVETLGQLEQAARAGRLRNLAGFGPKTEQNVLELIGAHSDQQRRFRRAGVQAHAEALVAYLKQAEGVTEVVVAGSYRRGKETVGDLDLLVTAAQPGAVMERFGAYEEVAEVVSRGPTRSTVILRSGLQVDLRVVAPENLGAALHYFTGSKAHNIQIRRLGQQRGLKINEYGVFRDERRIAGETEESVFRTLGLPFIPPELRQGSGEIEAAREGRLPELVTLADLRGDLHLHTRDSDGNATIEEMALAAKKHGLEYIAITDHSWRLRIAHGLDAGRLLRQIEEIERLNERIKGIRILKGIEVDILEDGMLDLPDEVLSRLDLVIGAVHSRFRLSEKKQTARILRAMDQRYFSILAHPSGRLLLEREAYQVDMPRIIRHARERGCFLELNAQPKRLDLNDSHCRLAKEEGVPVAINSDGHNENACANLVHGIGQARRGWLEKGDVLNTRPLGGLRPLLAKTMG